MARVSSGRSSCCPARFIPVTQLDELVWADLCAVLQQPQLVAQALQRAHSGAWVPGELRRRQATLRQVRASVARQRQRLLEAYLAEVIDLAAFQRQERTLAGQEADLLAREREVAAQGERLVEVSAIAQSMTQVLEGLRVGLGQAGFEQRRQLVELLIDRVVVTDGQVEIRYVIPTTPGSTHTRFCHLRTDYFHVVALPIGGLVKAWLPWLVGLGRDHRPDAPPAQVAPQTQVAVALVTSHRGRPRPVRLTAPASISLRSISASRSRSPGWSGSTRAPRVQVGRGRPPPGTGSVLVGPHHRPVHKVQQPVQLAAGVRVDLQRGQDPVPDALAAPAVKTGWPPSPRDQTGWAGPATAHRSGPATRSPRRSGGGPLVGGPFGGVAVAAVGPASPTAHRSVLGLFVPWARTLPTCPINIANTP
jgi:hypothetical protein